MKHCCGCPIVTLAWDCGYCARGRRPCIRHGGGPVEPVRLLHLRWYLRTRSVCGTPHGRLSDDRAAVTCPRCIARLQKIIEWLRQQEVAQHVA